MNAVKKIIFPLFSLFLLFRSVDLIQQILAPRTYIYTSSETLIIALLLVLFITGVFAIPGFAYPTNRILPGSYYKIRNPRLLLRMYRGLGLKYFRSFLLVFFWGWKKNRQKYFNGTRSGLLNFVYQSKQSEVGHLYACTAIILVSFIVLADGHLLLFVLLTFLNVLSNFYPVLLQRYHRIRIEKLLEP